MNDAQTIGEPVKDLLETPYVKFWMEGEILCGEYAKDLHINLNIAIHIVSERLRYTNNTDRYCIADIRGVRSATKEARQHLAIEGSQHIIACAILVDSLLSKTLGNIFLTVNKPPTPMRLFTSKADAKEWLKRRQQEAIQAIKNIS